MSFRGLSASNFRQNCTKAPNVGERRLNCAKSVFQLLKQSQNFRSNLFQITSTDGELVGAAAGMVKCDLCTLSWLFLAIVKQLITYRTRKFLSSLLRSALFAF